MSDRNFQELDTRALINIGGGEAETFLQGILTCNIEAIAPGCAGFGGLLTPQGKILFDFFVVRKDDAFILDVNREQAEELMRRLTFYRLRAKVTLELAQEIHVFAVWGAHAPEDGMVDPRLNAMGWRVYGLDAPDGVEADYEHHRISTGMPQGGVDYGYGDAFPHEALYDQIGGVDFAKGCYVGQEVISRMHHRGTARKRVLQIIGDTTLAQTGTKITAGGKGVGEMGSISGNRGLAMLRLDRVKDAIDAGEPLMAADDPVQAQLQPWVTYTWPGK